MGQAGDAGGGGAQQRLWAGAPLCGLSMWLGLPCNQLVAPGSSDPSLACPQRVDSRAEAYSLSRPSLGSQRPCFRPVLLVKEVSGLPWFRAGMHIPPFGGGVF